MTTSSRFLRLADILGSKKAGIPPMIPVSRATWYAGVADGRFPKPVKLGPRLSMWREEDIQRLVREGAL